MFKYAIALAFGWGLDYNARVTILRKLFTELQSEYREDNLPTNVASFFEEILKALPNLVFIDCEVELLFKDELKRAKEFRNVP